MYRILLLTDQTDFTTTKKHLSQQEGIVFDHITLPGTSNDKHKVFQYDYKKILNSCLGKDDIILDIKENHAIYLIDILSNEKELSSCHFIIMESPLIDFYTQPLEKFFINRAIRKKLVSGNLFYSFIRPFSCRFLKNSRIDDLSRKNYKYLLLSEISVYNELLQKINSGLKQNDIIYFLTSALFSEKNRLLATIQTKMLFFRMLNSHFMATLLKNKGFYKKWMDKDALFHFLKNIDKLPNKILLKQSGSYPLKQENTFHQINTEQSINLI